jgi:phospholipid transport system substrate-binding protein
VIAVLRDGSIPRAEQRRRVEEVAYTKFDFSTISRLVLARNWRRLSSTQRAEFEEEFKRHLSLSYGKSLEEYTEQTVSIDSTRAERNGDVTVRTRILGAAATPLAIDYRLRLRHGEWRMIDVIVEGVSLIQNFRTQTQEIISDVGPERLIEILREKNETRAARS